MTDYAAVLTARYTGAEWTLNGDDYDGLTWLSDSEKPSREELDAAWPQVQHDLAVSMAQSKRQVAYIAEADPLFFEWQAGEGTEAAWQAKREEIKQRYPLPE